MENVMTSLMTDVMPRAGAASIARLSARARKLPPVMSSRRSGRPDARPARGLRLAVQRAGHTIDPAQVLGRGRAPLAAPIRLVDRRPGV
jgi:hypothetical protein